MRPLLEILRSEEGPTSVEYAVVLALILGGIISAIGAFGFATGGLWGGNRDALQGVGFIR